MLVGIIVALIGAHYASTIWEIRQLREKIDEVQHEVVKAALDAAVAATSAAAAAAAAAAAVSATREQHRRSEPT